MNPMQKESYIKAAQLAAINSKAIKSGIEVGCVLIINPGARGVHERPVAGCNVECHGADTIHAEVSAVCNAIAQGYGMHDVIALFLWFPKYAQPPCGCCLQFLSNWFDNDLPLICAGPDTVIETTLGEALPFAYKERVDVKN